MLTVLNFTALIPVSIALLETLIGGVARQDRPSLTGTYKSPLLIPVLGHINSINYI
jgi:hypothetical protein